MIGGVTRGMLPHLSGVPHLHVNRPKDYCTADDNVDYMAESVFAMRLVNLRSVTCYTDKIFKENAHFGGLNLFTSEKMFK